MYDRTPLGYAAINGHRGVAELLLGREDVDLNCLDANDRTLLGCAAIKRHERVVKLLLEHKGVDFDRPGKRGGTPRSYATRSAEATTSPEASG